MRLSHPEILDAEYKNDQLLIARQIAEYEEAQENETQHDWRNMYMLRDARKHEIAMYVCE